jgi:hypothetical protein
MKKQLLAFFMFLTASLAQAGSARSLLNLLPHLRMQESQTKLILQQRSTFYTSAQSILDACKDNRLSTLSVTNERIKATQPEAYEYFFYPDALIHTQVGVFHEDKTYSIEYASSKIHKPQSTGSRLLINRPEDSGQLNRTFARLPHDIRRLINYQLAWQIRNNDYFSNRITSNDIRVLERELECCSFDRSLCRISPALIPHFINVVSHLHICQDFLKNDNSLKYSSVTVKSAYPKTSSGIFLGHSGKTAESYASLFLFERPLFQRTQTSWSRPTVETSSKASPTASPYGALNIHEGANSFEILGIHNTATEREIKQAYLSLIKKWHPDRFPTDQKEIAESVFKLINKAFVSLKK